MVRRLELATGFWARLGLAVSRPAWGGLRNIVGAVAGIHTCWMEFALDVVWLDAAGRILAVRRGLQPWRFAFAPEARKQCWKFPRAMPQRFNRREAAAEGKRSTPMRRSAAMVCESLLICRCFTCFNLDTLWPTGRRHRFCQGKKVGCRKVDISGRLGLIGKFCQVCHLHNS